MMSTFPSAAAPRLITGNALATMTYVGKLTLESVITAQILGGILVGVDIDNPRCG